MELLRAELFYRAKARYRLGISCCDLPAATGPEA